MTRQRASLVPSTDEFGVDYRRSVTLPIRDMWRDGTVVFLVTVYGWTSGDVCVIPGGSDPFVAAVRRIGLDPDRYQAVLWDTMYA
jgi:hypothetical protein